jgi:hypothetical protein
MKHHTITGGGGDSSASLPIRLASIAASVR